MATKTRIANMVMALLGQARLSDVDTDTSEQALWVKEIFEESRDEALRAHNWNFASTRKRLDSEPSEQVNPKPFSLRDVVWAEELSLWVAVGALDGTDAYLITSPDNVTWTERANPKNFTLNSIIWTGSLLVAVGTADGTDAYIITSADAITWTERANPKNFALRGITWDGSLLVAVGVADGTDAYIITSADAITWTERANPKNFALRAIVWTGSIFVAVGAADGTDAYIVTSPDGTTWTERANLKNVRLVAVAWSGARLVAVGDSTGTSPYTVSSDDGGTTWTERTNSAKAIGLKGIAYSTGFFVAVGDEDTVDEDFTFVVASRDGESWGERILAKNIGLRCIRYYNNIFMMAGDDDGRDAFLLTWAGPPSHGYSFGFGLPADSLKVYDVNDGERLWKQEEDTLLTDSAPFVDIRYVRQVTDPLKFDGLFSRALAFQIAKDLCVVITGSDERMAFLDHHWNRALGSARTNDSQEGGDDPPISDPWVAARWGTGGSWWPTGRRGWR